MTKAKTENVSQKYHDRRCTQVTYDPWSLLRLPCGEKAYKTIGYDTRDLKAIRFCRGHWDDFERAMRRDAVFGHEPEWQWLRDHIIGSAVSQILARVMREGVAQRKRREAGKAATAQVIKAGHGLKDIVYFVQAGDAGPIKIGFTGNVRDRFAALQLASPETLHLRAFTPGSRDTEREYHWTFRDYRIGGEWFSPVGSLLATIDAINAAKGEKGGALF